MAYLETPHLPEPKAMPQYVVGAASPLWAYFGAAAVGGVAFWWMTRWARPANLEAMFAKAAPVVEPVLEAVEAVAEAPVVLAEAVTELEPVAETFPELAAASDAPEVVAEPEPAPALEVAPEPVLEAAPEPFVEAAPGPVIEAEPTPEPVLEAAPVPAATAQPATEAAPEAYAWDKSDADVDFATLEDPALAAKPRKKAPKPDVARRARRR